ncbi:MAG: hypothetical protein IJ014_05490 [Rikenellaceae bacterium]|nr:hypothetical protein [Rikenellaceae bacterium]
MKKLFTLILCAAALVGCSYGVEEGNDTPAAKGSTITITADATRIAHNYNSEDKTTYTTWSNGDAILVAVYDGDTQVGTATLTNTAAGEYATFTGSLAGVTLENKDYTIEAIYPADVTASAYEKGKITIAADAAQHVMIAKQQTVTAKDNSINLAVQFMPMVSRLHVTVADTESTAAGFGIIANTAVFAKTATIDFATGNVTGSDPVNMVVADETSNDFYVYFIPFSTAATWETYVYDANKLFLGARTVSLGNGMTRNKTYNLKFNNDTNDILASGKVSLSDLFNGDSAPDVSGFKNGIAGLSRGVRLAVQGEVVGVNIYFYENNTVYHLDASTNRSDGGNGKYNQASIFFPIDKVVGAAPEGATKLRVYFDATNVWTYNGASANLYVEYGTYIGGTSNWETDGTETQNTPAIGTVANGSNGLTLNNTNQITGDGDDAFKDMTWTHESQYVDIPVSSLGSAPQVGFSIYGQAARVALRNVSFTWVK